jgi:N-acetylglutamate synthase-like GNAT family acetyltransferase
MPEDFEEVIHSMKFLVAEREGRLVGFGFLDPASARIEALFVDPVCQGRGIGKRLLDSLEMVARDSGAVALRLSSTLNAVEFYRTAGFRVVQEATYHHAGGLELACTHMEKRLSVDPSRE